MRILLLLMFLLTWSCADKKSTIVKSLPTVSVENLPTILDTIWRTEQEPISARDSLMRIYGDDSEEYKKHQTIYERNHKINEDKVRSILDNIGWPKHDNIGEQGNWTISNVLQHSSIEVRNKYLPMMQQAVKEKQLEARFLVRAEDRLATDRGELQIYGGQMKFYPETKSFNVWPVHDPANIDKRRAAIGLGPIKEFLKQRFDFDWNLEEQIKRSLEFENQ